MKTDERFDRRTRSHHPQERATDGPFGWLRSRENWYRDVWLFIITVLVFLSIQANGNRVDDIQASRVEATLSSCQKTNEVIAAYNHGQDLLATLVVSSVLSPGDKSLPPGQKDPFKWSGVRDGPLSLQVQKQIPGYPNATIRLKRAQAQALQLQAAKIRPRDCDSDVAKVASPSKNR